MIVDANVLLYAVDESAHHHDVARDWLTAAMNGDERVGLPWSSLLAFQRISTNPRVSASPRSTSEAWRFITDWLDADQTWIPEPGTRHRAILERLLVDGDLRGNLVTDAHLAALAIEHGTAVCSFDTDFAGFDGLRWYRPHHR